MQGDKEEVCEETERRMGGEMMRRGLFWPLSFILSPP